MKKHDTPMRGARITGYGTALPEKILTNADLEEMVDTTDEWIVERSGIRERRIGGSTSGLAIEAAQKAMDYVFSEVVAGSDIQAEFCKEGSL